MINNIKINGLTNGLGYNLKYQQLRWQSTIQQPLELFVINQQSEEVIKQLSIASECCSVDLDLVIESRTRYQCCFKTLDGIEQARFEFESGKQNEQWTAEWISSELANPIFNKSFYVDNIEDARLYLSAKGIYQVTINNQSITDEVLLPGYYSYDLWQQANTFDISPFLIIGQNKIEIQMTDGWYRGRLGFSGGASCQYGEELQLIAELYQDRHTKVLITDEQWNVTSSHIIESSIYDGESQDYTANKVSGNVKVVNKSKDIEDRMNNRILKHESLIPKITRVEANQYLLDFEQNMTGWIEFDDNLEFGQSFKYVVGEVLQDGKFFNENLRTAKAEFKYVSDGSNRHVSPVGTFYGFRYALVTTEADIEQLNIQAHVIHSRLDRNSTFESNDSKINRLYQNIIWGQKGNFLDIPTDCPQRDERLGWTGDAQVFAYTAALNFDVENFFRNYLYNMRYEQQKNNRVVPLFIPDLRGAQNQNGGGVAAWSDAATIIPWTLYQVYQNKNLLAENYPLMKDWADHLIEQNSKSGNRYLWQSQFQLGDWLALDGKSEEIPVGGTDTTFIASIYFYLSVLYTAKATEVLELDASYYTQLAEAIKTEIHNQYITNNGMLVVNTQTAYALVIEFDIAKPEQMKTVKTCFLNRLFDDQFKIKTGFLGTPILLSSLSKIGFDQIAVKMFENEQYPGWLYSVNLGATTIWERWNTILPDGKINSQGMNSLNHYAYGSVGRWIYQSLLGITVDELSKTIIFNPNCYSSLKTRSGSIQTATGVIDIKLTCNEAKINVELELPIGYNLINKANKQVLQVGRNILIVDNLVNTEVEQLSILDVITDYRYRKIVEQELPIIFNDDKVKANLDALFIDIRDVIVKKRMISEQQLAAVVTQIKNII